MKKQNYFVKSNYPRREGDFYPTIDSRCVQALIETMPDLKKGLLIDPCAPTGSGIVDSLRAMGLKAKGTPDAFTKKLPAHSFFIVSNPPYKRGIVNQIIQRQIDRIATGEVLGVAMLLRSTFDHAKIYMPLFSNCRLYAGQIKLTFRPRWIKDSKGSPIHNYVWQIWQWDSCLKGFQTWVKYW